MGKIKKNDNRRSRCGRSVVDFCPWLENERDDRPGRGRTFPSTIRSPNHLVPVPGRWGGRLAGAGCGSCWWLIEIMDDAY